MNKKLTVYINPNILTRFKGFAKENNLELVLKKQKEYGKNNKERISKSQKEYYIKNKNKINKRNNNWREKNKEKHKQLIKKWVKNNPEKIRKIAIRNYYKDKDKHSIRQKTRWKYGKLPKGFQYHHTTKPYTVDEWICVHQSEHRRIELIC